MDNQNTNPPNQPYNWCGGVLILVLMDNQNTLTRGEEYTVAAS